jgi:hypothetical protein
MHNVKTNAFPIGDILGHYDLAKGHSDLPTMHADRPFILAWKFCANT